VLLHGSVWSLGSLTTALAHCAASSRGDPGALVAAAVSPSEQGRAGARTSPITRQPDRRPPAL